MTPRPYAVPCLVCGVRTYHGPRCPDHERTRRRQPTPTRTGYTHAEKQRRAAAVAEHIERHGSICPGYKRTPHYSEDLTAHHVVPVGAGGAQDGPLAVLCRGCNSRAGAQP